MNNYEEKLLEKSIEAFTLAIEIYNKPTIKYRVEGFSFFVCNAWELMLKSHILKTHGSDSIYYKDNPNRTISLENCISKIFTNNKDPLRINLEKIVELRNTSTHFITEEYEMVYISLFQSCILNFNEKIMQFHKVDMTSFIPQNFLTLSVSMNSLENSEIIVKYPEEIATKLVTIRENIADILPHMNDKFAIRIEHHHFITKNKSKATSTVAIDNASDVPIKIIKELKDPNVTHNYNAKSCIAEINSRIFRKNILISYPSNAVKFNQFHFQLFCTYYGIKSNNKYCYKHDLSNTYSYSMQTIDFIFEEIKKDPANILQNLKDNIKK